MENIGQQATPIGNKLEAVNLEGQIESVKTLEVDKMNGMPQNTANTANFGYNYI